MTGHACLRRSMAVCDEMYPTMEDKRFKEIENSIYNGYLECAYKAFTINKNKNVINFIFSNYSGVFNQKDRASYDLIEPGSTQYGL